MHLDASVCRSVTSVSVAWRRCVGRRLAIGTLLLVPILVACEPTSSADESRSKTRKVEGITQLAAVPAVNEAVETGTQLAVDPAMVDDCVEYTMFAAFTGDVEMQAFWDQAGQDEATLRANCVDLGATDPARLAALSAKQADLDQFFAAAAQGEAAAAAPAPDGAAEPGQSSGCHPSYTGACVPIAFDVDCLPGDGDGPEFQSTPVQVVGDDKYGLDADNDGLGCEPVG